MFYRTTQQAVVGVPTTAVAFLALLFLGLSLGCQPPIDMGEAPVDGEAEVSADTQELSEEEKRAVEARLMDQGEISDRLGVVRPTITAAQVRHTFITQRERWVPCFEGAAEEEPAVEVEFTVNPAGEVVDVAFVDPAQGESEVGRCLEEAVRGSAFAVTTGPGNQELRFRFRPGAGQSPSRLSDINRR